MIDKTAIIHPSAQIAEDAIAERIVAAERSRHYQPVCKPQVIVYA